MSETYEVVLDGHRLGTGLLMPTVEEVLLSNALMAYPTEWLMPPKDIERCLIINGKQRYIGDRMKRKKRMRNQDRLGKCNASSNASGGEQCRETQGMPHIALSDCFTYLQVNGGRDEGSGLPSTYDNCQKVGWSPYLLQCGGMTKTFPNNAYNKSQVPADVLKQAYIEASRFKGIRFVRLPTDNFKLFCHASASAIARDQPIIFAWHVGENGSRLNNGYVQVGKGARDLGNHSNVFHSGKWVGGTEMVHPDDQNSWGPVEDEIYGPKGPAWGDGGFGLFTMEDAFRCAHIHPPYIMVSIGIDETDAAFR
jgi:hypothetical protein